MFTFAPNVRFGGAMTQVGPSRAHFVFAAPNADEMAAGAATCAAGIATAASAAAAAAAACVDCVTIDAALDLALRANEVRAVYVDFSDVSFRPPGWVDGRYHAIDGADEVWEQMYMAPAFGNSKPSLYPGSVVYYAASSAESILQDIADAAAQPARAEKVSVADIDQGEVEGAKKDESAFGFSSLSSGPREVRMIVSLNAPETSEFSFGLTSEPRLDAAEAAQKAPALAFGAPAPAAGYTASAFAPLPTVWALWRNAAGAWTLGHGTKTGLGAVDVVTSTLSSLSPLERANWVSNEFNLGLKIVEFGAKMAATIATTCATDAAASAAAMVSTLTPDFIATLASVSLCGALTKALDAAAGARLAAERVAEALAPDLFAERIAAGLIGAVIVGSIDAADAQPWMGIFCHDHQSYSNGVKVYSRQYEIQRIEGGSSSSSIPRVQYSGTSTGKKLNKLKEPSEVSITTAYCTATLSFTSNGQWELRTKESCHGLQPMTKASSFENAWAAQCAGQWSATHMKSTLRAHTKGASFLPRDGVGEAAAPEAWPFAIGAEQAAPAPAAHTFGAPQAAPVWNYVGEQLMLPTGTTHSLSPLKRTWTIVSGRSMSELTVDELTVEGALDAAMFTAAGAAHAASRLLLEIAPEGIAATLNSVRRKATDRAVRTALDAVSSSELVVSGVSPDAIAATLNDVRNRVAANAVRNAQEAAATAAFVASMVSPNAIAAALNTVRRRVSLRAVTAAREAATFAAALAVEMTPAAIDAAIEHDPRKLCIARRTRWRDSMIASADARAQALGYADSIARVKSAEAESVLSFAASALESGTTEQLAARIAVAMSAMEIEIEAGVPFFIAGCLNEICATMIRRARQFVRCLDGIAQISLSSLETSLIHRSGDDYNVMSAVIDSGIKARPSSEHKSAGQSSSVATVTMQIFATAVHLMADRRPGPPRNDTVRKTVQLLNRFIFAKAHRIVSGSGLRTSSAPTRAATPTFGASRASLSRTSPRYLWSEMKHQSRLTTELELQRAMVLQRGMRPSQGSAFGPRPAAPPPPRVHRKVAAAAARCPTPQEMARLLFVYDDRDGDGYVSYDDFCIFAEEERLHCKIVAPPPSSSSANSSPVSKPPVAVTTQAVGAPAAVRAFGTPVLTLEQQMAFGARPPSFGAAPPGFGVPSEIDTPVDSFEIDMYYPVGAPPVEFWDDLCSRSRWDIADKTRGLTLMEYTDIWTRDEIKGKPPFLWTRDEIPGRSYLSALINRYNLFAEARFPTGAPITLRAMERAQAHVDTIFDHLCIKASEKNEELAAPLSVDDVEAIVRGMMLGAKTPVALAPARPAFGAPHPRPAHNHNMAQIVADNTMKAGRRAVLISPAYDGVRKLNITGNVGRLQKVMGIYTLDRDMSPMVDGTAVFSKRGAATSDDPFTYVFAKHIASPISGDVHLCWCIGKRVHNIQQQQQQMGGGMMMGARAPIDDRGMGGGMMGGMKSFFITSIFPPPQDPYSPLGHDWQLAAGGAAWQPLPVQVAIKKVPFMNGTVHERMTYLYMGVQCRDASKSAQEVRCHRYIGGGYEALQVTAIEEDAEPTTPDFIQSSPKRRAPLPASWCDAEGTDAAELDAFVRNGCVSVSTAEEARRARRWLLVRGIMIERRNISATGANTPLHRLLVASVGVTAPLGRVAAFLDVPIPAHLDVSILLPASSETSANPATSMLETKTPAARAAPATPAALVHTGWGQPAVPAVPAVLRVAKKNGWVAKAPAFGAAQVLRAPAFGAPRAQLAFGTAPRAQRADSENNKVEGVVVGVAPRSRVDSFTIEPIEGCEVQVKEYCRRAGTLGKTLVSFDDSRAETQRRQRSTRISGAQPETINSFVCETTATSFMVSVRRMNDPRAHMPYYQRGQVQPHADIGIAKFRITGVKQ